MQINKKTIIATIISVGIIGYQIYTSYVIYDLKKTVELHESNWALVVRYGNNFPEAVVNVFNEAYAKTQESQKAVTETKK